MIDSVPATPQDAKPTRPWLGADGRIRIDIPCQHCRYDLRTLKPDGICPECGHPVSDSARDGLLRFSYPRWVKRLRLGALLLLIGIAGSIAGSCIQTRYTARLPQKVGEVVRPQRGLPVLEQTVSCAAQLIVLGGLLLLTTREPVARSPESRHSPRLLLRTCLPVLCAFLLLDILQAFTGIGLHGWAGLARGVAQELVSALAFIAFLQQLINLLRRAPSSRMIRFAQIELWVAIPALAAFLVSTVAAYAADPGMAAGPPHAVKAPPPVPTVGVATSLPRSAPPPRTEYIIVDESGAMTRTTTVPASVPILYHSGASLWGTLSSMICTYGMYVVVPWVIGAIVLIILVERTLARAARQAAELDKLPQVTAPVHDLEGKPGNL